MLLSTVVIWSFNIVVTRYVLTHGFRPLAYASIRYGLATVLFAVLAYALERSFAAGGRRSLALLAGAALFLCVNQLAFVYALKLTTATTVSLILGTTPVFTALIASTVGLERLTSRFWAAALLTFGGVALVAVGSGGDLSADLGGDLLALGLAASWAAYSVSIAPLMRTYSPYRISTIVLVAMMIPLSLVSIPQLRAQDFGGLGNLTWLGLGFAVVGPLVLTNVLWFTAIDRVGPSRATLFANLQPFMGAVFALLLLDEKIRGVQIAGGFLIAAGIVLERAVRTPPAPEAF